MGHVALLPPSLQGGGVQRVVLNLAEGFLDAGFKVDMVLLAADEPHRDRVPPGAEVHVLDVPRAITSIRALARYLVAQQPDLLLAATEPVALAAVWARIYARRVLRCNLTTRIVPVIMNTPSAYQARRRHRREMLYPLLARRFFPQADHVIAIADAIREDVLNYYRLKPGDVSTIRSPVLTPDFYQRLDQPAAHPWLETHDLPVVLGVARFVPAKDLGTLLRAFARVRQDRAARLILLGDGPERQALETLAAELGIQDDVSMPGFLPNLPYMRQADVFVLSSIFEGLPTVLIEALAASPAVVSTDCPGGIREILADGAAGYIVPVGDPVALAAAIQQALDTPIATATLRAQAQQFEMRRILAQYRSLFFFDGGAQSSDT